MAVSSFSVSFNKSLLNSFEIARAPNSTARLAIRFEPARARYRCRRHFCVVRIDRGPKTPAASPLRRELMTRRTKS